jgi:hypothetical protein
MLHPLENHDKMQQNPDKYRQPVDRSPAQASSKSFNTNITVRSLDDPHTSLLETFESESCNYVSVSTDAVERIC